MSWVFYAFPLMGKNIVSCLILSWHQIFEIAKNIKNKRITDVTDWTGEYEAFSPHFTRPPSTAKVNCKPVESAEYYHLLVWIQWQVDFYHTDTPRYQFVVLSVCLQRHSFASLNCNCLFMSKKSSEERSLLRCSPHTVFSFFSSTPLSPVSLLWRKLYFYVVR